MYFLLEMKANAWKIQGTLSETSDNHLEHFFFFSGDNVLYGENYMERVAREMVGTGQHRAIIYFNSK